MNGMTVFIAILVAALTTYLTRFSGMILGRFLRVTPRIERGLNYVPIGVFAALIAPSIILQPGNANHHDWRIWLASLIAVVIAWVLKSPLWTMIIGVAVITGLRLI